ncbi:MAG: carbohydrate kinase [Lentisphaerae bacterium]|nr:carbohydrate kinase [Lentisphaerota bacterium]
MIRGARAEAILEAAQGKRVLVVGDLMLDRYILGSVSRISPEAPVPVVHVMREEAVPGGAANVALNIQALGGGAVIAGLVGQDAAALELNAILNGRGIQTDGIVTCESLCTTVKTRVIAERQQVVRFDREDRVEHAADYSAQLCERLVALIATVDGVVIEDYGKGVLHPDVVACVMEQAGRHGVCVGYDPKDDHPIAVSNLTIATPNFKEACVASGESSYEPLLDPASDLRLKRAAAVLLEKWTPALLCITLGPHGMYLCSPTAAPILLPTRAREVFDVSGAGDTVIAASLLGLLAGASHIEAASLANYAAGIVCAKVGTAPCTRQDVITALGRAPDA